MIRGANGVSKATRCGAGVLGSLLVVLATAPSWSPAAAPPPTIKDLENGQVEVNSDPPKNVDVDKTMQSYQRFLDLNSGDAGLRAEALRRLGDLHLESSESAKLEKELAGNEALQATDAITLYTALLRTYPDFERNDSVLYQLARAHELNADPGKALATLDRLVTSYPHSRYLDEAQFRRGELLFSAKQYPAAQSAYEAVIAIGPTSAYFNQSLYKHGWSLFKQGDDERSLDSFARVLDAVLLTGGEPPTLIDIDRVSRANRELVEDTFRVMAITFSYLDGPKSIDAFLQRMPPRPYAYLLYSRLGDLYAAKERYTDAADSYRAFVLKDRDNEKAPLLQMQALDAYARGGFPQLVLQGKQEFVEDYNFGTPYWQGRMPQSEPTVVAELKTNLEDVAQYYHAEAQRTKSVADYQVAARWYRSYLTSFPDDPDSAVTNFLLADTLYESKQYLDAAKEYSHTAYDYGEQPKAAEAGYAAVVAYGKEEEGLTGDARAQVHAEGLDSSLKFADAFPGHPESARVLARAATELYRAKDYDRATGAAEKLLARQPPVDPEQQRIAWTVIANSNFEQGAYDKAETAYSNAQALMPPNDPERPAIVERLAASIYKQGEAKNQAGDSPGAVGDFLRVAQLAPGSQVRANADFDAAALLITNKQWAEASVVLEGFRRNFPQSPLQADVTRKLAVAYSESDRPDAAAVEFERIAESPGETPEVRREATLQAADLFDKAQQLGKARAMLEAFVKRFPQPLDPAMDARNRLSMMAAKAGDGAAEAYWLRDIVAADRAAGAGRTDRSRALAAKATLALAMPLRDEFRRVKLVAPLKKSLAEKRAAMEAALKAFGEAADYQIADVTTAATYESAELYRQLGKDLIGSERPRNLSKDELEQYDVLLEEQAFPFEEKSIKLHEVNAARTKEGTYDQWVQKSFAALAQLNPGRYGKTEISEARVDSIQGVVPTTPAPAPPAGAESAAAAGAVDVAAADSATVAAGASVAEPTITKAASKKSAAAKKAAATKAGATEAAPAPAPVPELAASQYAEALDLMSHDDSTAAELEFQQLATAYPDYAGPQLNLGMLYTRTQRLGEAESVLQDALTRNPASAAAASQLGIVERKLGKFKEAEAAYQRAIAADPNYAPAYLNLGILYDLYLAQPQQALDELERYVVLAGENKQVSGWVVELRKRVAAPVKKESA
jgi:tetratricopeptide (TPR) repeat protein